MSLKYSFLVTMGGWGSVEDAVGAGVYGIVGNDRKVSYKYTSPLSLSKL